MTTRNYPFCKHESASKELSRREAVLHMIRIWLDNLGRPKLNAAS